MFDEDSILQESILHELRQFTSLLAGEGFGKREHYL